MMNVNLFRAKLCTRCDSLSYCTAPPTCFSQVRNANSKGVAKNKSGFIVTSILQAAVGAQKSAPDKNIFKEKYIGTCEHGQSAAGGIFVEISVSELHFVNQIKYANSSPQAEIFQDLRCSNTFFVKEIQHFRWSNPENFLKFFLRCFFLFRQGAHASTPSQSEMLHEKIEKNPKIQGFFLWRFFSLAPISQPPRYICCEPSFGKRPP